MGQHQPRSAGERCGEIVRMLRPGKFGLAAADGLDQGQRKIGLWQPKLPPKPKPKTKEASDLEVLLSKSVEKHAW